MKKFFLSFFTLLISFVYANVVEARPEFVHECYYVQRAATGKIDLFMLESFFGDEVSLNLHVGDKVLGYAHFDDEVGISDYYSLSATVSVSSVGSGVAVSIHESSYEEMISGSHYALIESEYTYKVKLENFAGSMYLMSVTPVQTYKSHIVGDMNGDGKLSIEDVTLLTSTLLGERDQSKVYGYAVPQAPKTYKLIITTQDLTTEEYDPSIGTANEYTAAQLSAGVQLVLPPYTKSIAYPASLGSLEVKGPLGVIDAFDIDNIVINDISYTAYVHWADVGNNPCNATITIK